MVKKLGRIKRPTLCENRRQLRGVVFYDKTGWIYPDLQDVAKVSLLSKDAGNVLSSGKKITDN